MKDRQTNRQMDREETEAEREREKDTVKDRQTYKQTDRQTDETEAAPAYKDSLQAHDKMDGFLPGSTGQAAAHMYRVRTLEVQSTCCCQTASGPGNSLTSL